jgi:hypothetical protein
MKPRKINPDSRGRRNRLIGDLAFEAAAILIILFVLVWVVAGTFLIVRFVVRHYKVLVPALILLILLHFVLRALGRNGFIWRDEDGILRCFEGVLERRER